MLSIVIARIHTLSVRPSPPNALPPDVDVVLVFDVERQELEPELMSWCEPQELEPVLMSLCEPQELEPVLMLK